MSKGFLSAFYPDEWVDSAYSIDYEKWYARGFRAVIFDIDNTLVPHGEPADARARGLFRRRQPRAFTVRFPPSRVSTVRILSASL